MFLAEVPTTACTLFLTLFTIILSHKTTDYGSVVRIATCINFLKINCVIRKAVNNFLITLYNYLDARFAAGRSSGENCQTLFS